MALKLQQFISAAWADVDLVTQRLSDFNLKISASAPATLTFVAHQPHQDLPIEPYTPVRFWDDAGSDPGSTAFSDSNPTFLGFVEDPDPGDDGRTVNYTCLDSTARAANEVPIMSRAWTNGTTPHSKAVPRLIVNATIDNDDDWVFSRAFGQETGEIIAIILDDQLEPLRRLNAAPAAAVAYVAADLAGMDFEPQEKAVFTSEAVTSGVRRMMQDWEPEYRMVFRAGARTWRFFDVTAAAQVTLTLNDFTGTHPVLQFRLERSLENRYTAVKFYGPEAFVNRDITLSGGGLTDISTGPVLEEFGAGVQVLGKNKWQITDADERRVGRILPTEVLVPSPEFRWAPNAFLSYLIRTKSPTFLAKYKNNSGGTDAWQATSGWFIDQVNGIIDFGNTYVYRWNDNPEIEGGILQPNRENPVDVRFIYPSFADPLAVRIPATGHEGTANSLYGLENEWEIYDEMLAVGWLYGQPVTSATRKAKFEVLARKILDAHKDVVHMGGATLDGLDYQWLWLDRRINIAGVDGDGDPLTTGWESINAILTDVEYDYEEQLTTLTFSADQLELAFRDPEQIKAALKIGAAEIRIATSMAVIVTPRRSFTEFGTPILGADVTIATSATPFIFDPFFGTSDAPEFS